MNSLRNPIAPLLSTTKRAKVSPENGMSSERSNIPTERMSWQKRRTTSQARSGVYRLSTRYNHGSHYENHQRAAEMHDIAAHAHRSAAEAHEKQEHQTGHEHSRQALEHSQRAYQASEVFHSEKVNEHGVVLFGHQDIAQLAHQLWQARGCPVGSPEQDWFDAVRELAARTTDVA
jgi:hypothetical protein